MKIQLLSVSLMIILASSLAQADDAVTNAKAAELALHRLERLVILKKVEASFQSKLQDIAVAPLTHPTPDDPSFKVTLGQFPGADGTQKKLEIILNESGRALSFNPIAGTEATNAPAWTTTDATSLSEDSLHFILDNVAQKQDLLPFFNSMTSAMLMQAKDAAGADVALLMIEAGPKDPMLHVMVKLDGTFDSYQIMPNSNE